VAPEIPTDVDRRGYLAALAGTGAASLAGCSLLERGEDDATTAVEGERARELAERFAPTLYFDAGEKWFPTDPRRYETDREGSPVVDGFDALDGYSERYSEPESPPDPTLFYHVVEYDDSPLSVVQFWQYSAFDQFTTNFHWHDWEVLHVFVDTDSGAPQLHVASSHARAVPNNEFLDPDPDRTPALLVELGSHSNALSVNEQRQRFRRLPLDGLLADITNGSIDGIEALAELPIAYGLPRDEGGRLPFAFPELDGAPIHEDDRLPSVDRGDLLDESFVVRSFRALASPPSALPERETGLRFEHGGREAPEADVEYDLVSTDELEHLTGFTGPQLRFEFTIPGFVEDAVAGHLTTTSVPWESPRYDNPAADISDPNHRAELAGRYDAIGEPAPASTIVASVTEATASDDAPTDEGVTTERSGVESVALLESDPEGVPTFGGGIAVLQGVPDGEHRLTINGAGLAPHSEAVSVPADEAVTPAGVEGEIPLVANEEAVKLEIDPRDADSELSALAIEDDFAGRLYDVPLSEPDAVYVHGGGAYTAEVRDVDDEVGATRVNPGDEGAIRLDDPRTGKASLATFLADIAEETAASIGAEVTDGDTDDTDGDTDDTDDDTDDTDDGSSDGPRGSGRDSGGTDGLEGSENAVRGLRRALIAIAEAARRAAERAESGDREGADTALESVSTRLERAAERLAEARGALPPERARATERRLEGGRRRSEQAADAGKL